MMMDFIRKNNSYKLCDPDRIKSACKFFVLCLAVGKTAYRNPKIESVLLMLSEDHGFEETLHCYGTLIGMKKYRKNALQMCHGCDDIVEKTELQKFYEFGKL